MLFLFSSDVKESNYYFFLRRKLEMIIIQTVCQVFLEIGQVRYINILTWLRGFRVKIVNFLI